MSEWDEPKAYASFAWWVIRENTYGIILILTMIIAGYVIQGGV